MLRSVRKWIRKVLECYYDSIVVALSSYQIIYLSKKINRIDFSLIYLITPSFQSDFALVSDRGVLRSIDIHTGTHQDPEIYYITIGWECIIDKWRNVFVAFLFIISNLLSHPILIMDVLAACYFWV